MAFPEKESRQIMVDNQVYNWVASGNDGWIDLYIQSSDFDGQKLQVKFQYNDYAITPIIVKQVINFGLENNWKPLAKGKVLNLHHVDHIIKTDINE